MRKPGRGEGERISRGDTDLEAAQLLIALYRGMTPVDKLQRVRDLMLTSHRLALAGLRLRHPEESDRALRLRLARRRLGRELAAQLHGGPGHGDGG